MENKYLCVMALFDDKTNNDIQKIRDVLKENNLPFDMYPPHFTIGAYVDLDETTLVEYTRNFCLENSSIYINLDKVDTFGDKVIFLTSNNTNSILELHRKYHSCFDDKHGNIGYNYSLESGNYTPHMTLLQGEQENIQKGLELISKLNIQIKAKIPKIGIYEFHPMREIAIFDLK